MSRADADTPDEVLVVAAMLGDLDAFDALVLRYRSGVVRTAQAIVGREDAEDVAQEAFLIAFKALPGLEEPRRFAAWLAAITRHFAFRYDRRARARSRGRVAMDELLIERVPAVTGPRIEWEQEADLHAALNRVPADHAIVLRLHFLDGMPLKRIAAFLGVSLATVKWRVHRGKQQMRDRMGPSSGSQTQWKENRK